MAEPTLTVDERSAPSSSSAALHVVLTAQAPWLPSSRHVLTGVKRLDIRRGETRDVDRASGVLALPDRRLSSEHARLRFARERWEIEDLRSKNGVLRNGVAVVGSSPLEDGDVLELGHSFLVFRTGQVLGPDEPLDQTSDALAAAPPGFTSLIPALARRFAELARAAASPLPILVLGETGTGKELAARAVHALSGRPGALVPVNCGALPRSLLESELFGFKRGSFSGAMSDRPGLVAASHRGTLFLDEIADLPLDGQAALLRVLQEREVLAIGATQAQPLDLRVVSATHHDLQAAVASRTFRADLFARLRGFSLVLPPLRERREDLGMIVQMLLGRIAPGRPCVLSHGAARALFGRSWSANVRELEHALQEAIVMAHGDMLELPDELAPIAAEQPAPLRRADRERRAELERLLREHRGNVASVARTMGKAREQVHRWIKRAGLDPAAYRE